MKTLRSKLIAIMVGLLLLGLVVSGLITHTMLKSFLLDRFDQQLYQIQAVPDTDDLNETKLPTETLVSYFDANGKMINWIDEDGHLRSGKAPRFLQPSKKELSEMKGYRILTLHLKKGQIREIVIARSLEDVQSTLQRLLALELVIGLSAAAFCMLLGIILIKKELEPLKQIETKAERITQGDLTHRIENLKQDTEIGHLGEALNSMLERLEKAFDEQTKTEEKLRQFIEDAAHELRTPLTSLQGYAELYRKGMLPDDNAVKDSMIRIEQEAKRMALLLEDLFLLAKLDHERPLEKENVELGNYLQEIVRGYQVLYPDWSLKFTADKKIDYTLDRIVFRRAIDNILNNMRRYAPGPVEITLNIEENSVVIAIMDHGPGIPAHERERLFDRFARLQKSRVRTQGGTGLGLAIAKAVLEAYQGQIKILDTPGGGATFVLSLPL